MAAQITTASERGSPDDVTDDTNIDNCLHDVDDASLAAQLASAIKGDSINDVKAALEQGAPVNFLYKVKLTYLFSCLVYAKKTHGNYVHIKRLSIH